MARDHQYLFRMNDSEYQKLKAASEQLGVSMRGYLSMALHTRLTQDAGLLGTAVDAECPDVESVPEEDN